MEKLEKYLIRQVLFRFFSKLFFSVFQLIAALTVSVIIESRCGVKFKWDLDLKTFSYGYLLTLNRLVKQIDWLANLKEIL